MKKSVITDKTIRIYTLIIIILAIASFELGYFNAEFLNKIITNADNGSYNFSVCRIVVYILIITLYFTFRKKFVEEAIKVSENKFKRIFIYIASISAIAITIVALVICLNKPVIFRAMSIGILTVLLGNLFVIYVSNNHVKNIVVTLSTFGIIFSITTNFNHAIDEKKHFMEAFNIAFLNLNYVDEPITDKKIEELPQLSKYTLIDNFMKQPYKPEITHEVDKQDVPSTPAEYPTVFYIPSAIGIAVGTALGGSIIDIYILGRLCNLILYGVLICIALKIMPFKKNIFSIVFLMPMTILLAGTYSIDGVCIALVSIFVAYCLRIYNESKIISLKQFAILSGIFLVTLLAKNMAYITICLIIFILPLKNTLKKYKKYIPIVVIITIILVIGVVFFALHLKRTRLSGGDTRGTGHINSEEQIEFLINNPLSCVELAINHIKDTLINYDWYGMLHSSIFFTVESRHLWLPMMLFILYISLTEDDINFKIKEKIIFILTFLATVALTSLPLYLTFTEVGAMHIQGYQTRYILPVLPLILMSISNNKVKGSKNKNRNMNIAIANGVFIILGIAQLIIVE